MFDRGVLPNNFLLPSSLIISRCALKPVDISHAGEASHPPAARNHPSAPEARDLVSSARLISWPAAPQRIW